MIQATAQYICKFCNKVQADPCRGIHAALECPVIPDVKSDDRKSGKAFYPIVRTQTQ